MAAEYSLLIISMLLTPVAGALAATLFRKKKVAEMATVASAALVLVQAIALVAGVIAEKR